MGMGYGLPRFSSAMAWDPEQADGRLGLECMMLPARSPSAEADRLAALRSYEVLDTSSEDAFDDLIALAARLTASPIALVSLVDAERLWFKAHHGLDGQEIRRSSHVFCAHTILDPTCPLVVEDATADARFQASPLVTGAPDIRA